MADKTNEPDRKKRNKSLYYLLNISLPSIKNGVSNYQEARQDFISMFPEFSEYIPEKFDPSQEIIDSEINQIRDLLRNLPREDRIWAEEFALRMVESLDHAQKALDQNMKEIVGEDFPRSLYESNTLEAYKRLEKKLIELTADTQSLTKAEKANYSRAKMDVIFAWDFICMNAELHFLFKEPSTNPNEIFCLIYELGKSHGLSMTLDKNQFELMNDASNRIKGSEARSKGWEPDRLLYKQAEEDAEKYWKSGGTDYHNVMAKSLSVKYFGKYDDRTRSLRKRLTPIAKKYNKALGIKGVKKEK